MAYAIILGEDMKKWVVFMAAVAAVFMLACGSNGGPADNGQDQDTVTADNGNPDTGEADTTVPVDTGVDTAVEEDTATPEDTTQPDTNVPVDEGQPPLDTAVGCPEGATTGATCWQAGSCAVLCDDTAFLDTCMASADQTVKDAFAAFSTCIAGTECADVFAGEQITACVADACATELAACFVGDKDCRDMWTCRKDCDASDPACPMRCFTSGTAVAQEVWVAYKDCIMAVECATEDVMENGWPTFNCEQNARGFCTIPYQACFPPT